MWKRYQSRTCCPVCKYRTGTTGRLLCSIATFLHAARNRTRPFPCESGAISKNPELETAYQLRGHGAYLLPLPEMSGTTFLSSCSTPSWHAPKSRGSGRASGTMPACTAPQPTPPLSAVLSLGYTARPLQTPDRGVLRNQGSTDEA